MASSPVVSPNTSWEERSPHSVSTWSLFVVVAVSGEDNGVIASSLSMSNE